MHGDLIQVCKIAKKMLGMKRYRESCLRVSFEIIIKIFIDFRFDVSKQGRTCRCSNCLLR